jgi:Domain of unknown function (DUF6089)
MKRIVPIVRSIAFLSLFLIAITTHSQSISTNNGKFEVGLGLGPSFFVGDLGGTQGIGRPFIKDLNLPLTKFSMGAYVSVYPAEWIGFRLAINRSVLEGADSIIKDKGGDEYFRKLRNLSFRSTVLEAYFAAEISPTVFFEQYEDLKGKFRPYGVIGIGAFKFNPKTLYNDPSGRSYWVELQPLHTEGQGFTEYPDRKNYSLTQLEIPMGIGFKYYLKENMYVGLEVLHRKTFTDYIDDVSTNYIDPIYFDTYLTPKQATIARRVYYKEDLVDPTTSPFLNEQRGDPTQNDAFFSTILRFGWRLNGTNGTVRQMRCPVFY